MIQFSDCARATTCGATAGAPPLLEIGGRPIQDTKLYRAATNSFLGQGATSTRRFRGANIADSACCCRPRSRGAEDAAADRSARARTSSSRARPSRAPGPSARRPPRLDEAGAVPRAPLALLPSLHPRRSLHAAARRFARSNLSKPGRYDKYPRCVRAPRPLVGYTNDDRVEDSVVVAGRAGRLVHRGTDRRRRGDGERRAARRRRAGGLWRLARPTPRRVGVCSPGVGRMPVG